MIYPCSNNHVTIKNEAHLHTPMWKKHKLSVKKRSLWKTIWHYLLRLEACISNRPTIFLLETYIYICMSVHRHATVMQRYPHKNVLFMSPTSYLTASHVVS